MLIFFGRNKALIGSFDVFMYECPYCEQMNTTSVVVYSIYYHIFWIPLFPYNKEAIANCSECRFLRNELKFGPKLVEELGKKKFKHPWWTWSWVIIFFLLILSIIIVAPK